MILTIKIIAGQNNCLFLLSRSLPVGWFWVKLLLIHIRAVWCVLMWKWEKECMKVEKKKKKQPETEYYESVTDISKITKSSIFPFPTPGKVQHFNKNAVHQIDLLNQPSVFQVPGWAAGARAEQGGQEWRSREVSRRGMRRWNKSGGICKGRSSPRGAPWTQARRKDAPRIDGKMGRDADERKLSRVKQNAERWAAEALDRWRHGNNSSRCFCSLQSF